MKQLILLIFSVFINSCISNNTKWEDLKKITNVYPKDSILVYNSLADRQSEKIWVNQNYKNYPYKKYCEHLAEVTFELSNSKVKSWLSDDSLSVAKSLQYHFKKKGVAHFVGQTIKDGELKIYLYHDDNIEPVSILFNFIIPNVGMIKSDPEWKEYSKLLTRE